MQYAFTREGTCLSLERSVHQEIYGRRRFVAWHETLSEVTREIVVRGVRSGPDDMTDRFREAPLHVEPQERSQDAVHLFRRDPVVLRPAEVENDSSRAES